MERYSRTDPETGLPSRLLDYLKALDYLVDHALENGVDLVVFAGDAYQNREPSQTHQREFAKRSRRLAVEAGMQFAHSETQGSVYAEGQSPPQPAAHRGKEPHHGQ